eukprot:8619878-Heterocapsa_arctica.AAC.1
MAGVAGKGTEEIGRQPPAGNRGFERPRNHPDQFPKRLGRTGWHDDPNRGWSGGIHPQSAAGMGMPPRDHGRTRGKGLLLVRGKDGGIRQVHQGGGRGAGNCKKGGSKDRKDQAAPAPREARCRSGRCPAPTGGQVATTGAQGQFGQSVGGVSVQAQAGAVPAQGQRRPVQTRYGRYRQQGNRSPGFQQALRTGVRTEGVLPR